MKFNNNNIYSRLDDPAIEKDFEQVQHTKLLLVGEADGLALESAEALSSWMHRYTESIIILRDIATYAALERVVDSTNEDAQALEAKADQKVSEFSQILEPITDRLMTLSDEQFSELVGQTELTPFRFQFEHERKLAVHRLSVAEETLLTQMSVDGLHAWGDQYMKLAGSLSCDLKGERVGLASAFNQTMSADRDVRETAWRGIQQAWSTHADTVVAGLNAINGWRLSEFERRSKRKPMHYLDVACHQSHIERETLTALMETAYRHRTTGQKAIRLMNRWNRIEVAKPWDLMAPPRSDGKAQETIGYDQALQLVSKAFAEFDPDMGEFVHMMDRNGWIDAQPTPNRATGAFCTNFNGVREPRVFMTYEGTMGNVLTLAHEIGHAWHNWVMRDMPKPQTQYPMTLAETASIFAETLVRQSLLRSAENDDLRREILWQEAETASALMVNIPARFEFEQAFVEQRKQSKVSANQARILMRDAWQKWYEDSISEYDEMFWASKLHFSISGIGFYNYPYLFGYLFALGVYAQKDKQGDNFRFAYRDLLRDTGQMTAEDCIQKHLYRDIRKPEFWQDSISIVANTMDQFETLV